MRLLEIVLVVGIALLLLGWAAGWRLRRWFPLLLLAVGAVHLLVEGPRLVMVVGYLVVVIAAIAVLVRRGDPRPPGRGFRAVGRWAVAVVALALAIVPPWIWPVMRLPRPTGPNPVGTTWIVVRDSSRPETHTPEPNDVRELPVKVWYPAPVGATGPAAKYADPRELNFAGMAPAVLFAQARYVETHSIQDAPIASGRFPVLIFSHGYTGYPAQNTPQMEELASRGYVVFSIAHPGEASGAVYPDGRVILMDQSLMKAMLGAAKDPKAAREQGEKTMKKLGEAKDAPGRQAAFREFLDQTAEPLRSQSVAVWSLDTKAVVDRLEALDRGAESSTFAGHLDLERLGVFGMSYGGATAGEFCSTDRRCKAALNIDGGQYGRLVDDSLTIPFFIMGSEQAYPVHLPVLDLTRGPAYLIRVPETTHIGLTDVTLTAPVLFRWSGLTGKLDPNRREAIMTAYVRAFFDTYLKHEKSSLLAGPSTEFPEVAITMRNAP